jgi:hypothetical protein
MIMQCLKHARPEISCTSNQSQLLGVFWRVSAFAADTAQVTFGCCCCCDVQPRQPQCSPEPDICPSNSRVAFSLVLTWYLPCKAQASDNTAESDQQAKQYTAGSMLAADNGKLAVLLLLHLRD